MIFDVKKPRKTKKKSEFCDSVTEMCTLEPLVYIRNSQKFTESHFSENLTAPKVVEDILAIICGTVGILVI